MNADRHHQRHDEQRRQRPAQGVEDHAGSNAHARETGAHATPIPETHAVPEGTFAASQLAERLQLLEANLREISAGQKLWAPPKSELNLRDRTA